jgi:hypothetical protein
LRNVEPTRISTQEVWMQALAVSVPWLGPPSETQSSTFASPPTNLMYQRVLRLPIEWATMSTLVAPGLFFSSVSTRDLTSVSASVLFEVAVL